jgi:hypothetical protein
MTKWGNPYCSIHVDMLHQSDLGVFKTLLDIIQDISATFTNSSNVLLELDKCLFLIKVKACFLGFCVPGIDKGGYFSSNANFVAFKHHLVM